MDLGLFSLDIDFVNNLVIDASPACLAEVADRSQDGFLIGRRDGDVLENGVPNLSWRGSLC